ncbi:MAG TPA: histidine kinase [Pilimelia sp.]|nr:histidine kinase [Pilimelia sp.]
MRLPCDEALQIVTWLPDRGYVDGAGRPAPSPPPGRHLTPVLRNGGPVGAIIHDRALGAEPELLVAATGAAGLVLAGERLTAELAASRSQVTSCVDAERRRIERNLHDGPQQRLYAAAITLALAAERLTADPRTAGSLLSEARDALAVAIREVRELSHGIHPAAVLELGLAGALRDMADRSPVPVTVGVDGELDPASATAVFYVVAEGLTNAAKHAAAEHVTVAVRAEGGQVQVTVTDDGCGGADARRGQGLRGLADRLAEHGGSLVVESGPGGGTVLRAEFPCA